LSLPPPPFPFFSILFFTSMARGGFGCAQLLASRPFFPRELVSRFLVFLFVVFWGTFGGVRAVPLPPCVSIAPRCSQISPPLVFLGVFFLVLWFTFSYPFFIFIPFFPLFSSFSPNTFFPLFFSVRGPVGAPGAGVVFWRVVLFLFPFLFPFPFLFSSNHPSPIFIWFFFIVFNIYHHHTLNSLVAAFSFPFFFHSFRFFPPTSKSGGIPYCTAAQIFKPGDPSLSVPTPISGVVGNCPYFIFFLLGLADRVGSFSSSHLFSFLLPYWRAFLFAL